ncbi:hypothetical protein F2P56_002438 [Juglans regia]|uniref:Epidermal patterning factor-like protein n=1 Tax=Juglans regia TaxID=51240 RepID=A0A833YCF6_JUGRE|nr:hypothetical protein F2P56_002438 [Juglans regia]
MKKTMCCFLMCGTLQIIIMTSILVTTIRPLKSYHAHAHALLQHGQSPHFPQPAYGSKQGLESGNEEEVNGEEEKYMRLLSRLGSRPPSCLHKCEGCIPCYPIQIPATTDHVGLHYANYEPEGWKCKCRSSIFNP